MFKQHSIIEKTFYSLLPVQIVMITVLSINSIIDGAVASRFISAEALGAIALFMPVVKLLETINSIFMGGSQILCGQYIGKNMIRKSSAVFSTDLFSMFLVGLTASLSCFFFSRPIASLFIKDAVLLTALSDYIFGFSFGIIPMLFIPQLSAFLQMENQKKRTYVGIGTMIVMNISLDILFVSVFDLGMFGLGLATSISSLAFCLVLASYYVFKTPVIRFRLSEVMPKEIGSIARIGFPGAVSNLGQTVRAVLLNTIILSFVGNEGVSAFSAVNSFGAVYWACSGAVATAVRVLSSIYAGEEDRTGLHAIMKTALAKGLVLVCAVAVVCMLCAPLFTGIFFGPEAGAVYRMALTGFILFPVSMPFSCLCSVFSAYYQCLGRIKIVNLLMFMDGLFGVIAFSFLLAPVLGMTGVWLAQIINGLLTTLVILFYTRDFQKKWPSTVEDLLVLEDSFGVQPNDRIDIQVSDMNEVINLSESVVAFSRSHGIDGRRAMVAGLCIEEMTGNIVLHGFNDGKDHNIDVRVVYKDDGLLLRMKDNCRIFNPKEVQDLFTPEDVTHNIGLRLVSGIAESMSYNNALGINVLTITI